MSELLRKVVQGIDYVLRRDASKTHDEGANTGNIVWFALQRNRLQWPAPVPILKFNDRIANGLEEIGRKIRVFVVGGLAHADRLRLTCGGSKRLPDRGG
jgi:hypothetical protein